MYKLTKFSLVAGLVLLSAVTTSAQRASYDGTYQSVRQLILRIESRTDTFQASLNTAMDRGRVSNSQLDELRRLTSDFDSAGSRLRTRFERRQATTANVQDVLNLASQIDNRLNQERVNARTQNNWANLRSDLTELARTFRLSWSTDSSYYPNQPSYPNQPNYRGNQLTGTFRLDPSRSDDPSQAADRAVRNLSVRDRERLRNRLMARLESPDQIAIERRGRTVTIASSRASQITFEADGSQRTETTPNGRTIRATANLSGDQLIVATTGDRASEFSNLQSHRQRPTAERNPTRLFRWPEQSGRGAKRL
jgi:hypothetical protein